MLLQFMQSDPALLRYSHIIIDEIHERSTHSDFVVTLLKEIVAKVNIIILNKKNSSQYLTLILEAEIENRTDERYVEF